MITATTTGKGKKVVLLVGDPPAVDKFDERMRAIGHDVITLRNAHSPGRIMSALRPGIDCVVAMNVRSAGAAIKEASRKLAIEYVSVPPSWSAAQTALKAAGILSNVQAILPLTHRPLAEALRPKPPAYGTGQAFQAATDRIAEEVLESVDAAIHRTSVLAPVERPPRDAPPPEAEPEAEPEARPAAEPLPEAPAKVVGVNVRQPTVEEAPAAAPAPAPKPPPYKARLKGAAVMAAHSVEKMEYAEAVFRLAPDLDPQDVNAQIVVRFGRGLDGTRLYDVRRKVRAALGLPPAKGTWVINRPPPATPPEATPAAPAAPAAPTTEQPAAAPPQASPAPVLAPAEPGGLPEAVLAAQTALVEALRAAVGVQSYVLTFVGGQAEVEFEAEVRRVAKGKTSL